MGPTVGSGCATTCVEQHAIWPNGSICCGENFLDRIPAEFLSGPSSHPSTCPIVVGIDRLGTAPCELRAADLVHLNRLERHDVDPALVEDRLHPLRRAPAPAPGLLGVLRVAVLRGPLAASPTRRCGPELREDVVHHLVALRRHAAFELAPKVLAALPLARSHLGLGLAEQVCEPFDTELCDVNFGHSPVLL